MKHNNLKNTPITTATIEGQQYTIKNPEDLGIEGKPIFATDETGKVHAFPNHKATNPVTQTLGEIDQAKQQQDLLNKNQVQINGVQYVLTGDQTPEGYVAIDPESGSDIVIPSQTIETIKQGNVPQPETSITDEVVTQQEAPIAEQAHERKVITQTIGNTPIDIIEGEEFDEVVPTEKVPLEKALPILEKKFKDNKRFKVVAEKAQIEEPGETKYDDPIKKTIIKSIKIVPVEVLEKQKQTETDNLLKIVEEYNATLS